MVFPRPDPRHYGPEPSTSASLANPSQPHYPGSPPPPPNYTYSHQPPPPPPSSTPSYQHPLPHYQQQPAHQHRPETPSYPYGWQQGFPSTPSSSSAGHPTHHVQAYTPQFAHQNPHSRSNSFSHAHVHQPPRESDGHRHYAPPPPPPLPPPPSPSPPPPPPPPPPPHSSYAPRPLAYHHPHHSHMSSHPPPPLPLPLPLPLPHSQSPSSTSTSTYPHHRPSLPSLIFQSAPLSGPSSTSPTYPPSTGLIHSPPQYAFNFHPASSARPAPYFSASSTTIHPAPSIPSTPTPHPAPTPAPAPAPAPPHPKPSPAPYTPAQSYHPNSGPSYIKSEAASSSSPPLKPAPSMKITNMLSSAPTTIVPPSHDLSHHLSHQLSTSIPPSIAASAVASASTTTPDQSGMPAITPTEYRITMRQPPVAARSCGFGERDRRVIDPPPIIQMTLDGLPGTSVPSASSVSGSSGPHHASAALSARHHSQFAVVHCSIWNAAGTQDTSSMPEEYRSQRRLMGTLVASPFVGQDEKGETGCFFCFPDLSVRTPGKFRLRFVLVIIDPRQCKRQRFPIVAQVMSKEFTVFNAKDFPGMRKSTELTRRLKEQGCLISIKKGNERGEGDDGDDDERQKQRLKTARE